MLFPPLLPLANGPGHGSTCLFAGQARPVVADQTSALSILHLWVEAFKFDAGIMGCELPVDAFLGGSAPLLPLLCFIDERLHIWNPPVQALDGEGTQLDLGDIEPTTVFGGVVDLQSRGQSSGLLGRESLLERAHPMRIEMITDQPDRGRLGILDVQELLYLCGPVQGCSVLFDTDGAPPT